MRKETLNITHLEPFFPFFRQLWTWIYLNVWKCIDLYWFAWVSSLVLLVSGLAPLLPDHHLSRATSHALLVFFNLPCYQIIICPKLPPMHYLYLFTSLATNSYLYSKLPHMHYEYILTSLATRSSLTSMKLSLCFLGSLSGVVIPER